VQRRLTRAPSPRRRCVTRSEIGSRGASTPVEIARGEPVFVVRQGSREARIVIEQVFLARPDLNWSHYLGKSLFLAKL
jgi:hypothetical protein